MTTRWTIDPKTGRATPWPYEPKKEAKMEGYYPGVIVRETPAAPPACLTASRAPAVYRGVGSEITRIRPASKPAPKVKATPKAKPAAAPKPVKPASKAKPEAPNPGLWYVLFGSFVSACFAPARLLCRFYVWFAEGMLTCLGDGPGARR